MAKKSIKQISPEMIEEITILVNNLTIERLRTEEATAAKMRYDKKRANTKTLPYSVITAR